MEDASSMAMVGRNIRALRKADRLDAGIMAEQLGISTQELYDIEAGKVMPTVCQLETVADIFCMTLDEIIDGKCQTEGIRGADSTELPIRARIGINRIIRNTCEMKELLDRGDASGSGKETEDMGDSRNGGIYIDGRSDSRERLGYVVAWERDIDCMTVRNPRDVSTSRFETVGAFPTYETAIAFIRLIESKFGGYEGWMEHAIRHPFQTADMK